MCVWVSVYRDESDSHTVSDAQSVFVFVNESKKHPIETTYGMLINVILIEMLCYPCHLKCTHLIKTQESKFTKRKSERPLKTSVFIQLHLIPHSKQGQKHILHKKGPWMLATRLTNSVFSCIFSVFFKKKQQQVIHKILHSKNTYKWKHQI